MQSNASKSAFNWNPNNQALAPELDHPAPFESAAGIGNN